MLTKEEEARVRESLAGVARRASEAIRLAPDAWQAIGLVKSLHASIDEVSQVWRTDDPKPECKPGCSHCCNARVEVSDPEAFHIGRKLLGLPASELEELTSRLRFNAELRASSNSPRVPCAFLDHDMCSIYEHRPSTCRKAHSLSVKACANQEALIPQSLNVVLQQEVLIEGTNRAYLGSNLPSNKNELSAAVLAVLAAGANADDWYNGKPLLQPPAVGPNGPVGSSGGWSAHHTL